MWKRAAEEPVIRVTQCGMDLDNHRWLFKVIGACSQGVALAAGKGRKTDFRVGSPERNKALLRLWF